jgi:CRISPR/Cas system Type II protein with McrA/HNH and RuvC-like nuclease domain
VISVDHIIPRSVAPELDNVIANLELMPLLINQKKGNKVTQRQADLARKLNAAGLLPDDALRRVLAVTQ